MGGEPRAKPSAEPAGYQGACAGGLFPTPSQTFSISSLSCLQQCAAVALGNCHRDLTTHTHHHLPRVGLRVREVSASEKLLIGWSSCLKIYTY